MPFRRSLLLCILICCVGKLRGAEVLPWRYDTPPNEPRSAEEALKHFKVPDGFSVELVVAEPDVVNPIAMHFDDRGRIWITESVEYPRKPAGPGRDRVKILEDLDGDGRAEKVTVFADDLNIPTGVTTGYGGVWVLNAPDLLFFREKDGKAISREVVLTGFGRTDTHELPNSLTWGPDGWLYGLNGVFNECRITVKGKEFKFNCAMWRFHPVTRDFEIVSEGTSNPYGMAWDFEGSAIVEACHWANDHLFHFVEGGHYQRQAGAFPPYVSRIGSITDHGHQKTAYCGLTMFDSAAYPEKYRGLIYVGNIHGGCINVDRLLRDGSTYRAVAEPDFLTADDAWFMPVSLKVGPDGCMYVLDWYDRYHCSQDAARDPEGVDRLKGRLYRIRYKDTPRAAKFNLAEETDEQLVQRLASDNIFFREAAQRNLTERLGRAGNRELGKRLQKIVLDSNAARQTRLHAFWSLGGLDGSLSVQLLGAGDPALRAWAVRALGTGGRVEQALLVKAARDSSPDVKLQAVIAARKIDGVDALSVILEALTTCGTDKLIPAIAWNNLHPLLEKEGERFVVILRKEDIAKSPPLAAVATLAADRMLGATELKANVVRELLEMLIERDQPRAKEALAIVSRRLEEFDDAKRAAVREELEPVCKRILSDEKHPLYLSAQLLAAHLRMESADAAVVRSRFVAADQPENVRLQALESMIAFKDDSLLAVLPDVLKAASSSFARRVINSLGRVENPKLAGVIIGIYPKLDAELQPLAMELLLQRETWARQLLTAVRERKIPATLNANHLRKILESNDREAIWEVEKVFGKIREERNPEREKVVAEMTQFLRETPGDAVAGRAVFRKTCSQCHTIYGEGGNVGPDLTANGRASFEQLVSNVFDPSLVIAPAYQVTTVVTLDGRNLTGLVTEEGPERVVLKMPGEGVEAIGRGNIKYTHLSKLSMMPEGIETMLDRREIADLFAFLTLDRPPEDAGAKRIPGSPAARARKKAALKLERGEKKLVVKVGDVELMTFTMDPAERPYLHPVRDAAGAVVLTDNRPADHPWQHGIFVGFHGLVNGHEYWMEKDGQFHFQRLLDAREDRDSVRWKAETVLVAPDGVKPLVEDDEYVVHAPEGERYEIDFTMTLRALDRDVVFEKNAVAGLAVRMPWDQANPRQMHLNSEGQRGRACERQRAAWCNVERPFGDAIYGIAVFDDPKNPNHPPAWRVDEQGLINPSVTGATGWTLPAHETKEFRYRLIVYKKGSGGQEGREFLDVGR